MSKGLEAFERLKEGDSPSAPRDIEIVEKELKVLEIIKNKVVDIYLLYATKTLEDYNSSLMQYNANLTQDEFDLLKEVLL